MALAGLIPPAAAILDVEPDGRCICLPMHAGGMPSSTTESEHHSKAGPETSPRPAHYWHTATSDRIRCHFPDHYRHAPPSLLTVEGMQSPSSVQTERHRNYSNSNCVHQPRSTMDPPALDSALCRRDVAESPRPVARPVPVSISASEFDRLGYKDEASSNIIRCIDHFYETKSGLDAARDLLRILQLREERIESTVEDADANSSNRRQDLKRAGRPPPRRRQNGARAVGSGRAARGGAEAAPLATPTSLSYTPQCRETFGRRDSLTLHGGRHGGKENNSRGDEARQGGATTPLNLPSSAYYCQSAMVTPQRERSHSSSSFLSVGAVTTGSSAAGSDAAVAGPDVTPHGGPRRDGPRGRRQPPLAPAPPRNRGRFASSTDLVLPLPGFYGEGGDCNGAPYTQPRAEPRQRRKSELDAPTPCRTQPDEDPAAFSRRRVDLLMDYYKQISADRTATAEAQQQATADPNPAEEYPLPLKKKDAFESEKAAAGEAPSRAAAGRRRTRKKSSEGDSHDETASTADTRGSESTDPNPGGSQDDSRSSKMGRWRSRESASSSRDGKDPAGGGAAVPVDAPDKDHEPRKGRSFRTSRLSTRQRLGASSRTRRKGGRRRRRGRDASPDAGSHSTASTESVHSADSSSLGSNFSDGAAGPPPSGAGSRGGRPGDDDPRRGTSDPARQSGNGAANGRGVNSFIDDESEAIARDAMDLVRHHIERAMV